MVLCISLLVRYVSYKQQTDGSFQLDHLGHLLSRLLLISNGSTLPFFHRHSNCLLWIFLIPVLGFLPSYSFTMMTYLSMFVYSQSLSIIHQTKQVPTNSNICFESSLFHLHLLIGTLQGTTLLFDKIFFPFRTWTLSLHSLLICKIPDEKSTVSLTRDPLKATSRFSGAHFGIFSYALLCDCNVSC